MSRRALLGRLSLNGIMGLGASAAMPRRALASESCGQRVRYGVIGQTVQRVPAGDGRSLVETDCMPNHAVGPYFEGDAAPRPSAFRFYLPMSPRVQTSPTLASKQIFGVAINGVPFECVAPSYSQSDDWQYNVLSPGLRAFLRVDANNGHVYPNGQYHYLGSPLGLLCGLLDQRQQSPGGPVPMLLLGWAADGFPIYADLNLGPLVDDSTPLAHTLFRSSYRLKSGRRPAGSPGGVFDGTFVQDYEFVQGAGDLDEYNGRFGATPESPAGSYYYVLTKHFPFLPPFFRGKPDPSFATRSGPMALPLRLEGYTGTPVAAGDAVPEKPDSDAALFGLPAGLASAQAPLVLDSGGYRYFLAIGSSDGRLYYSSISIASGRLITDWQLAPLQAEFTTRRPNWVMLTENRFQVSIVGELSKLTLSTMGSVSSGKITFGPWSPMP